MIIALSAWKSTGKDTLAKILVEKHGFRRVAFADILKDMVAEQYGVNRASLDDPDLKEKPILSLPVSPKDKFSEALFSMQVGELKDKNGTPGHLSSDSQLYHTPRSLAILMGSVNRFVRSDYWVQRALKSISKGEKIVITDMRYKSEAFQIFQYADSIGTKSVTVRISRFASSPSTDPSERDLDDYPFDYYIDNKGSLEELELKTIDLLKTLGL